MSAPLRAADWRFLLPHPLGKRYDRLVVLGGPEGIAARARAMDLATVVETECTPAARADLVVARHDATDQVDRIAAAVAPAGCLYLEIDRERRGYLDTSFGRIRQTLASAGLQILRAYAVEPGFDSDTVLLPAESPEAFTWYARTQFEPGTRYDWLGARVRWAAARVLDREKTVLSRRFTIVATRGKDKLQDSSPSVFQHAQLRHAVGAVPDDLRVAMLTRGRDRVVFLPFSNHAGAALAVVKVPKHPSFNQRTINEHRRLDTLRRGVPADLGNALPEARELLTIDGLAISVQSFLPGRLLSSAARGAGSNLGRGVSDLEMAIAWLIRMHLATQSSRPAWDDAMHERWVEAPLAALAAVVSLSRDDHALVQLTRNRSLDLRGATLPIVCQHRDFNVWNIVREQNRIGVLDWEGAVDGLPLCDALQLVTSWLHAVAFPHRPDGEALALKSIFVERPWTNDAVKAAAQALDYYLREMTIAPRFLPVLLVSHRVELVLRRAEQSRLQLDDTPIPLEQEYTALKMLAEHSTAVFDLGWPRAQ